jgi:hypothetical protein
MEKPTPSDSELLADWLGRQREPAFQALVARYAGLVHGTAKRTCGDDSMAAEASQLTFITLAQKAKSLTSCASLGGWLHTTALMQAKNLIRKSQRENRKRQLLQAAMLAGFFADAQAALPISILASKAIATGSASAITTTSIIALLANAMKSTSLIVPAVALISSAALIAMQRHSIASLDGQTKLLQDRIAASDSAALLSSVAKPGRPKASPSADEPINWTEFVRKFEAMKQGGGGRTRSEDMGWVRLIENRLRAMSKEQLISELDRVSAIKVAPPFNEIIQANRSSTGNSAGRRVARATC